MRLWFNIGLEKAHLSISWLTVNSFLARQNILKSVAARSFLLLKTPLISKLPLVTYYRQNRPSKSSFLSQTLMTRATTIARGTEASDPCGAIQPCCSPGPSPLQVALHCPCGTSFHSGGWHISFFPTQPSHPCLSAFTDDSALIPDSSLKVKAKG